MQPGSPIQHQKGPNMLPSHLCFSRCIALGISLTCLLQIHTSADSLAFSPPVRSPGGITSQPAITNISQGANVTLSWFGLQGPYQIQSSPDTLTWSNLGTATRSPATVPTTENSAFFRVVGSEPNYAGAAVCLMCHAESHQNWADTKHAHAIESLAAIGQENNPYCVACHTVGYGANSGFKSTQTTPHLAGVQCENCHGPAANHAGNPTDPSLIPIRTVSAVVCGGCHTDAHHPTYDEWSVSRHGNALEGLKASGHASDYCLSCHSEDYRYAVANNLPAIPTIQTAQLSIECSTCHAPHGGVAQDHLIRKPLDLLCGECHTQGEATLGGTPHHPQFEMLKGIGAFQADGSPLVQPHSHTAIAKACAQCHVVQHHVDSPNDGNPNVTGHTFNPFDDSIHPDLSNQYGGCVECHSITPAFEARRTVFQELIAEQIDQLRPYFTPGNPSYIDPASLPEMDQNRWETARFNVLFVEADKSGGMHNFENARVALSIAKNIFISLETTP